MTHILILFFATFSAAFMATVPPGLLNMNAAKISVEKGKLNGIIFSLGVSSTIIVQAYIAVFISKFLYRNPEVIDVLLKIAIAIFAIFAVYFFLMAKRNKGQKIKEVNVSKKMEEYSEILIESLSKKVKEYPRFSKGEIEKFCWMAVHEYKHGVLPSEYDVREIDEDLYLKLLQEFKSKI